MNRLHLIRLAALGVGAALVLMTAACGDEAADPTQDDGSVLITPQIRVAGLGNLDDGVHLEDLYLGIGEIRLEPVDSDVEVVYVNRQPLYLHFDLDSDQWMLDGEPMLLPKAGEYLVSLRMDPVSNDDGNKPSMRIDGRMARFEDNRSFLDANSIEPTPLPMRTVEGGLGTRTRGAVSWVPWTYSTSQTVHVTLNNVHFAGDQSLIINFDVSAWVGDVIGSISREVLRATDDLASLPGKQQSTWPDRAAAVDVSQSVDASQGGLEHLGAWSEAFSY